MNNDAGEIVCIYEFLEGGGEHSPRLSYKILVGEEWVPWRFLEVPVLLQSAVIYTDRNGGRYAVPTLGRAALGDT